MFKNATIYRPVKLPDDMADNMDSARFTPLGASAQDRSVGWVPPREENGDLIEPVHNRWFVKVAIETKSVPASELNKRVDEVCEQIEQQTGRKPGKKERRQLKDDAVIALLPQAFPKRKDVMVMIDKASELIFIDTTSASVSDTVVTLLARAGLEVALVQTAKSPAGFMTGRLLGDEDDGSGFIIGRECELKSNSEDGAKVTFKNHSLHTDEVRKHVTEGKLPTKLALCDGNDTTFVLTDSLSLRKIAYAVPEAPNEPDADRFDADCVLIGSALTSLADQLIKELGGLMAWDEAVEGTDKSVATPVNDADLYEKAVEIVMQEQRASISLIQRHLSIGYNAAARLLEQMETNGLVSPMQPDGARKILESA